MKDHGDCNDWLESGCLDHRYRQPFYGNLEEEIYMYFPEGMDGTPEEYLLVQACG